MRMKAGIESTSKKREYATYTDNLLRPSFGSEHAENASTAPHIQHDLVSEEVLVIDDGFHVALSAYFIFEHFLGGITQTCITMIGVCKNKKKHQGPKASCILGGVRGELRISRTS